VIAPATASFLARFANGYADDLLGNTLLATQAPVLVAPAMHSQMWTHAATVSNISTLKSRGVMILEPAYGALTSGDVGVGRLPEPSEIVEAALALVNKGDLNGKRVVITAGGTRTPIDPVRFIGNRSSGKQGIALAEAARARGARVVLVAANLEVPYSGTQVRVETNEQLEQAVLAELPTADVLIMAAAIADFAVSNPGKEKISRVNAEIELKLLAQRDLLAEFATVCEQQKLNVLRVGFAAEASSGTALISSSLQKLKNKRAHLIVGNDISGGSIFGADETAISIVGADGLLAQFQGNKRQAADAILDQVVAQL
jgi:phosphopantothenoylcysteine decarboxylase/phosphopantothenate--cysteine ligase